jgi:DNA-binding GntR family transcriptional regulator/transposase
MAQKLLEITDNDRVSLNRMATSRRTTRGESTRAQIVLACAEVTVAEAARRSAVSFRTASKWKQRFEDHGIAGLTDAPRTGRPSASDDAVARVLTCAVSEPPGPQWTTRSIAEATGLSQTTVCRIRCEQFPKSPTIGPKLASQGTLLAFVYADSQHRILGFHDPARTRDPQRRRQPTTRAIAHAVETALCAALVCKRAVPTTPPAPVSTIALLRRAVANVPTDRRVIVAMDFEPDTAAKSWLSRNPHIEAVVVSPERWVAQLHTVTEGIDPRQLPELVDLQRRIRDWYRRPDGAFEWSRTIQSFGSTSADGAAPVGPARFHPRPSESTLVIHGLHQSVSDGTLYAGRKISERRLAKRVQLSAGAVSETLRQLAEDGLVHQNDTGRFFVPMPTERDVLETYTARGLLGTAIVRRLASRARPLPDDVDVVFNELIRSALQGHMEETGSLDLDVQDELARAAEMPRIETMFLRLTLQLRLFVTLMGLNYIEYPLDGIVSDDSQILDTIRAQDADAAVAAWRSKIDNCARYMVLQLAGRPRERATRSMQRS